MKEYIEKIYKFYKENVEERKVTIKNGVQTARLFKKDANIEYLHEITRNYFKPLNEEFKDVTVNFKYGPRYNLTLNPWIQLYYLEKNKKGTSGKYCGISINKEKNNIDLWLGFGMSGLKKEELMNQKEELIKQYKNMYGDILDKGFKYKTTYAEAIIISKTYNIDTIDDNTFFEDLKYLLNLYTNFENSIFQDKKEEIKNDERFEKSKKILGINKIYKGYPGSGKSFEINRKYLQDENGNQIDERCYERINFYPEYTNADFVGTIRPVVKNHQPTYELVPGPFSIILKRAIENENTNFYLIIEELNRGNAQSIFGDIFQLLDRDTKTHESIYKITNSLIATYIYNDENKKIYLPNNLSIIASMNVSDENVESLDTAFERRWDIEWILGENGKYDNHYIKGLDDIKWGKFRKTINELIVSQQGILKYEDKQLGAYFINEEMTTEEKNSDLESRKKFLYKVVLYLYNKICKYDRSIIFSENITSIQELIHMFLSKDYILVFNQEIQKELRNSNE